MLILYLKTSTIGVWNKKLSRMSTFQRTIWDVWFKKYFISSRWVWICFSNWFCNRIYFSGWLRDYWLRDYRLKVLLVLSLLILEHLYIEISRGFLSSYIIGNPRSRSNRTYSEKLILIEFSVRFRKSRIEIELIGELFFPSLFLSPSFIQKEYQFNWRVFSSRSFS